MRRVYFQRRESPRASSRFDPATILVSVTSSADGMTRNRAVRASRAPSDTTNLTDIAVNPLAAPFA